MTNLRNAMLVAVVAATALAAITGHLALGGSQARLFLDGGLAVALLVIVYFMLTPTTTRIDMLVEALRALARGDRHQRVDPDLFAGLGDVARSVNEVAAAMSEGDDPNLGPIRSTPRPRPTINRVPREPRELPPPDVTPESHHPEIGAVRVMKKSDARAERDARADKMNAAKASAPVNGQASNGAPAGAQQAGGSASSGKGKAKGKPQQQQPLNKTQPPTTAVSNAPAFVQPRGNDTSIDMAPRSDIAAADPQSGAPDVAGGKGDDPGHSNQGSGPQDMSDEAESMEPAIAQVPSRVELETLFAEFVAAKKGAGENVTDLDLEAFASTILGECERLVVAHRCRGVRFEVTTQDGEVSLRPRLLR